MITGKSLAKNFTIQTLGKFLAILIGLGSIALVTRTLGVERFGEYTTALTFLQFFGVIVDFGLSLTLIVMISEPNVNEKNIIDNFLGLRLVSGFLLFSIAPLIVLAFPWSQTIKQAVLVGALAYFLMGGATMLVGVFQKHESMWRNALAELINRFILLILIAICAYFQLGVVAIIAASVFANAIWFYLMIVLARPYFEIFPRFEKSVWKKIYFRSWPIAISIIFNLMYLKGDILLLAYFKTQTDVGMYGVAYRVLDILTVLPTMFMGLLLPSLVFTWKNGDRDKFKQRLSRTFDLFMLSVVPIVVGAQIVGIPLIRFIAGQGYDQGGEILKILSLALLGVFVGVLFGHLVVALDKQKTMVWGYAIAAILTLIGYFYFIPLYGVWGAAWMTVFSETFIAIITMILVYKTSGIAPHLSVFFKACFSALVMWVCLIWLPPIHVLLQILFGGFVYIIIMFAVKGVRPEDLLVLLPERISRHPDDRKDLF